MARSLTLLNNCFYNVPDSCLGVRRAGKVSLIGPADGFAVRAGFGEEGQVEGEDALVSLEALDLWALRGDLAVDVDDAGEAGEQGAVAEEEREQRGEGDGEQTPQQHEDPHGGTLALGKAGLE